MDRVPFFRSDWAEVVHRLADHVHDASQRAMANGGGNGAGEVNCLHTTHHPVRSLHSDTTHPAFAEMLLHLQDYVNRLGDVKALADHTKGLVNRRHGGRIKLHVHGRTGDLNYMSDVFHKVSS